TARGREFLSLWNQCDEKRPKADDPRVQQLLAWIEEERAALVEQEALYRRQEELEIERPEETGGLDPLDETWQAITHQLQQLDRQIDAKIRLLLRLEKRAHTDTADTAGEPNEPHGLHEISEQEGQTDPAAVALIHRNPPQSFNGKTLRYTRPTPPHDSIPLPLGEGGAPFGSAQGKLRATGEGLPWAELKRRPRNEKAHKNRGTKPSEPLESTTEAMTVGSLSQGNRAGAEAQVCG
ncbi:MAG: hypothetical protein ACRD2P_05300, partial [Terriglobia bacterium]